MTEKIEAPWTPEQVAGLNAYQDCGWVHPFTCACGAALEATEDGWTCNGSWHFDREEGAFPVVQTWAHAFMVEGCPEPPALPSPPLADDPA